MVTSGAQHAIALVARTIMARGDRALVENPTLSARAPRPQGGRRRGSCP